jgi:hypothetical protein
MTAGVASDPNYYMHHKHARKANSVENCSVPAHAYSVQLKITLTITLAISLTIMLTLTITITITLTNSIDNCSVPVPAYSVQLKITLTLTLNITLTITLAISLTVMLTLTLTVTITLTNSVDNCAVPAHAFSVQCSVAPTMSRHNTHNVHNTMFTIHHVNTVLFSHIVDCTQHASGPCRWTYCRHCISPLFFCHLIDDTYCTCFFYVHHHQQSDSHSVMDLTELQVLQADVVRLLVLSSP